MSATLVENKKVRMRFSVQETFSAGLELSGSEVKALRAKLGSLDGSRILVRGGEAYLIGATIPPYQMANTKKTYDPEKNRRLLLNKKEIAEIANAESKKGLTVVPLEVYNAGRYIKLRLAIVQGKGKADKREDMKRADAMRESERAMRYR